MFRPSKVTYMCVPISLTSWWITSSMQHSGLSSETAEFEADKLNLWELVCRSACERRESWDSSETKQLPQLQKITSHEPLPLQEYLWPLDCCHCARWCNWRRSRQGKYFCTGNGENACFESLEHWEIETGMWHFLWIEPEVLNLQRMLVINIRRSDEILYQLIYCYSFHVMSVIFVNCCLYTSFLSFCQFW